VFDVSTTLVRLVGGSGGVAAFADLGSGVVFGATLVAAGDHDAIEIVLNEAALAALNGVPSGPLAFGVALTTLSHPGVDENLFGGRANTTTRLRLTAQVLPEPAVTALLAAGLGLLLARRGRR
jgi:hypothetical protein